VGEDGKIRMSIWDNGGQTVFRTIQHLYISSKCCYVVVFNLTDFVGDETMKKKALEHLQFWLNSVKHHGVSNDKNKDLINTSVLYPPVILVGTHLDSVRKKTNVKDDKDVNKKLQEIHKTLINDICLTGLLYQEKLLHH